MKALHRALRRDFAGRVGARESLQKPSHCRGHWFDPSIAHSWFPLWLLGFLGQPPSLVAVSVAPRPQCDHIRSVPGRLERVGGVAVESFVEMSVDVEDRLDARVPEPRCDDSGVGAFGDEERDVAVSEVVEPHRLADRAGHGGEPDPGSEAVAADGAAFRGGEEQPVGSGRVVVEVLVDDVGEPGREGDGATGGRGLGLPEAQVAADLGKGAFDADDALVWLVAVCVEGDEFPDPAAGVGGGDHQRSVSGVDSAGELGDLGRSEEPLLGVLDLGQVDIATRGAGDESGCDRVVQDSSEELVGVADGGRRVPVGVEVRDPVLDVEDTDRPDRHVGKHRQNEAAQIRLVAGLGRVAAVDPPGGRLFGEVAETDPAGMWVDVAASELASLDGDEEPFGVDTAREVLRALAAGRIAPSRLPRCATCSVDNSADRRHKHLLPAHGNCYL